MRDLLIVGGVAAGATAAARARRLDNDVHITILEAGADVSFANCGLPYYIGGDIEYRSSLILASPQTFHDQYRVGVHTNTEAVRIDRAKKVVHARNTATGKKSRHPYDSLILAQGGKPVVPPIPGAEKDHVFALWTLDDMDRIDGYLTRELQDYGVELYLGRSLAGIEDGQVSLSDGSRVEAVFVLLSIGVRPTLALATDAGLEIGPAGGLAVDESLRTSDPSIFAAGDMVEIAHRVTGRTVRIPLAGPANRQGRIAAENALGGSRKYTGALGTSVVKLFDAAAGSTGLGLEAAREAGFDADAVVVHKTSHTAYYPGADKVSLMVIYDRREGAVLGAQAVGRVGVDKRLDVLATAIAGKLTLSDLAELDLAYAPPFNSPNGPVNMAAFAALNRLSGFSPAVLARDLEAFAVEHQPMVIDLRDPISYRRANLHGSTNLSQNALRDNLDRIPSTQSILLISDDGQKGHIALRMLAGSGFEAVHNLSGGYISLERHARAGGFEHLHVELFPVERKSADDPHSGVARSGKPAGENQDTLRAEGPLVIDVRTPAEFAAGAYPGSVNIPLDELHLTDLGGKDREIVLYCASGARSSYGQRVLQQMGYSKVRNGGGLHDMMAAGVPNRQEAQRAGGPFDRLPCLSQHTPRRSTC